MSSVVFIIPVDSLLLLIIPLINVSSGLLDVAKCLHWSEKLLPP